MTTDRELLELAAKASGMEVGPVRGGWVYDKSWGMAAYEGGHPAWNPLTDDGDALRLAVKLGIGLAFLNGLLVVTSTDRRHEDARDFGDDLLAATRRAIVMAAAEIGRAME